MIKLATISLLSLAISGLLCYSCLFTAKQIAKATTPRIEMQLDQ